MRSKKRSSLLTILIAGFFITSFFSYTWGFTLWGKKESDQKANGIFGIKKQSGGDVTVDLTPLAYEEGKLVLRISINTHNVDDLNKYDLRKITTLEIGSNVIKPVKTPRLGGHHNSGKIVFEVDELPKQFAIRITGLDSPGKESLFGRKKLIRFQNTAFDTDNVLKISHRF